VFVAAIERECIISLPFNMPRLLPNDDHYRGSMDSDYMARYMWPDNDGHAVLEYSMMNYTLGLPGSTGGILMDPNDGPYAEWGAESYWGSSLLVQAPMQNLPYFSLCSRGTRFGRVDTEAKNFGAGHEDVPFTLGFADTLGGTPTRVRGPKIKCKCPNDVGPVFVATCPHPGWTGDPLECITYKQADDTDIYEVKFQPVIFDNPTLGPGNDQFHLTGDWIVGPRCLACADAGVPPGTPWPADAIQRDPVTGGSLMLSGWDSRVPLTWVFEHPQACHLVTEEDTKEIGEWDIFSSVRYSDACDYIMTCMYEERSEIYTGKPYWFQSSTDNVLFFLSQDPIPTNEVSDGFCFPDVGPRTEE
jgi:hypothetical protein